MTDKFQNKYRIPSARWRDWNYADEAAYFVTICTKNRQHYFGKIVDGEMNLSDIGKMVKEEWWKSPSMRPDMNLDMEIFQIMPNHIHGIIVIGQNQYNSVNTCRDVMPDVSEINDTPSAPRTDAMHGIPRRDAMHGVSTTTTTGDNEMIRMIEQTPSVNHFGPQSKNLSSILRGFKSAVTIEAPTIQPDFSWQARFHDHVIRDDDEFRRIAFYIYENPVNWYDDLYFQ